MNRTTSSAPSRNKYRAQRHEFDGIVFHSKREAKRYLELKLLEKAGEIRNLERQQVFEVAINGIRIFRYFADFVYVENGETKIEDCKGFRTPVYRLKKKALEAAYGIKILET